MKLNLGCGRVIFPLDRDNPPKYHSHLMPLADTVYEPGWVNVDKFANPGVNEAIDLFRFPWVRSSNGSPFNDDSADEIWAAHILEHVPHQVRPARNLPAGLAAEYAAITDEHDGFFVFMAECWRILKPGGLIYIRAPFGTCMPSINDPTHTRYLTPGAFGYLTGQDDPDEAPFDYHLPCRFELAGDVNYRFRGEWAGKMDWFTIKGLEEMVFNQVGAIDEFRITLRALK